MKRCSQRIQQCAQEPGIPRSKFSIAVSNTINSYAVLLSHLVAEGVQQTITILAALEEFEYIYININICINKYIYIYSYMYIFTFRHAHTHSHIHHTQPPSANPHPMQHIYASICTSSLWLDELKEYYTRALQRCRTQNRSKRAYK